MNDSSTDARPLWIQAAEQHELDRAIDDAIATEIAQLELEEPADEMPAPPAPRTFRSHRQRSCTASSSPRFTRFDGAAPAHPRHAHPPAARSP